MVLDLSAIRNSMYLHWKFAIRSLLFASRYGSRFIRNQKFDVFALVIGSLSVIRYGSRFIRSLLFASRYGSRIGSLLSGLCYSLVVMVLECQLWFSIYFDVFALEVCYQVSVIR